MLHILGPHKKSNADNLFGVQHQDLQHRLAHEYLSRRCSLATWFKQLVPCNRSIYYWKCNSPMNPHVRRLVGLLAGRQSVIVF